ncbi:MAG: hypothetical protein R3E82_21225 [Pseudomonadales bacterium]
MVVNFQKLEGMLKSLASAPNYSGSLEQIQLQRVKHIEALRKKSLGMVVAEFFEKVYVGDGSERAVTDPLDYELTFTINMEGREELKSLLESIVLERNDLVHTRLLSFDQNSTESCADLERFLDEQYERVLPVFERTKFLFEVMKEARVALAETLSAEIIENGRTDV